jgi:hypothetical protein
MNILLQVFMILVSSSIMQCQGTPGIYLSISFVRVKVMVFNTTFNNISDISWRSVLLVEETGKPWENHWTAASHWQTLSHNVVLSTPRYDVSERFWGAIVAVIVW